MASSPISLHLVSDLSDHSGSYTCRIHADQLNAGLPDIGIGSSIGAGFSGTFLPVLVSYALVPPDPVVYPDSVVSSAHTVSSAPAIGIVTSIGSGVVSIFQLVVVPDSTVPPDFLVSSDSAVPSATVFVLVNTHAVF